MHYRYFNSISVDILFVIWILKDINIPLIGLALFNKPSQNESMNQDYLSRTDRLRLFNTAKLDASVLFKEVQCP